MHINLIYCLCYFFSLLGSFRFLDLYSLLEKVRVEDNCLRDHGRQFARVCEARQFLLRCRHIKDVHKVKLIARSREQGKEGLRGDHPRLRGL